MAKYAAGTEVPVEKTKVEIEKLVARYGASGYVTGWSDNRAMIGFQMRKWRVQFALTLPTIADRAVTHTPGGVQRSMAQARSVLEQHNRERWRAFLLVIKAKLEAVESGIRTFEQEFLNDIVMSSGLTVGAVMQPQLLEATQSGKMPPLLPGPSK